MEFAKYAVKPFSGHRKKVLDLNWNADGTKLVSGSADSTIRVWGLEPNGLEKELSILLRFQVDQVQFHPQDLNVFVSASSDKLIKIWDIRIGKEVKTLETKGANINLAWRPDGQMIGVGKQDNKVTFYDFKMMHSNQSQKDIKIDFKFEVNEIAWDKTSSILLITSGVESNKSTNSGPIHILDGKQPKLPSLYTLSAHQGTSYCISISSDNQYFATGGSDALVAIWDLKEMVCLQTYNQLEEQIRKLSFSYNSQYIATASEDTIVSIIQVEDGQLISEIECHAPQNTVCWHPNQMILAFAGEKTSNDEGLIKLFQP